MSGDKDIFVEPCSIRATHNSAFRSGEWAEIAGVKLANLRPCYLVLFDDGRTDLWPVEDAAAGYEFSCKRLKKPTSSPHALVRPHSNAL